MFDYSTSALRLVRRLLSSARGNFLPLFAIMVIPMIGAIGLGVDAGRGYLVKSKLSYALDAAGLAAGQLPSSTDPTGEVQRYFDANFPQGFMNSTVTGPTVVTSSSGTIITLAASAVLDTTFMRVLGHDRLTVSASAEVTRSPRPLDLVLAIDMSSSMYARDGGTQRRIDAATAAAATLVNALFGSNASSTTIKVGIVPWSDKVNVTDGTAYDSALTTETTVSSFTNPLPSDGASQTSIFTANNSPVPLLYAPADGWPGCVFARYNKDRGFVSRHQADTEYGTGTFGRLDWMGWEPTMHGTWNTVDLATGGTSRTCTSSPCSFEDYCLSAPISPLQSNKQAILKDIGALTTPSGSTVIPQGLAWAWRVLMPTAPFTEAEANPDPAPARMIVLLTDGENQAMSYDAYRKELWNSRLDKKLRILATAIKANGIEIVAIQFANSGSELETLMKDVASSRDAPHYFNAPDAGTLDAAFEAIGQYVEKVYLSK